MADSSSPHASNHSARLRATTDGHVEFLENVRDAVHFAAEAKRHQFEEKYSNETLASTIRAVPWDEARQRTESLANDADQVALPADIVEQVAKVLRWKLAVGTVEQIDDLLAPAVKALRDALERSRVAELANQTVVVATAGDLWKTLHEGKKPAVACSAISIGPPYGQNLIQPTFPQPTDQAKWDTLDRALALCDAEGGDRAEAMRKLIAGVALEKDVDRRQIINMPLADFVAAATGGNASHKRTAHGLKAGEAYLRAIENDPESKAALERAGARLRTFAKAMQESMSSPEYQGAEAAERQRWQDLADAIRENLQWASDELAARHFARPKTLEDWEHLARIVEIPEDYIQTGKWTAREIFARATAWADRQTIKTKLATDTKTDAGNKRAIIESGGRVESNNPADSDDAGDREAKLKALQPAARKAYFTFLAAEANAGKRLDDREAYDRLKEQGLPDNAGDLGEMTDYTLPEFDTWSRHLRTARNAVGEQKYTRRAGRPLGRSIVKAHELERPS